MALISFHSLRKKTICEAVLVLMLSMFALSNVFGQTYVIPTVVHIISPSAQNQLLTNSQIQAGIVNVNKQFSGEYATSIINTIIPVHQSFINNSNIKFELATIDPNGNPTNGITRTTNASWSAAGIFYELTYKPSLGWDRSKYFNIYVVDNLNPSFQSGVAYRPSEVASSGNASKDGALVTYKIWPTQFPLSSPQWSGFEGTMAHEVGHYLNLSHSWGQTNSPTTCSNPVCDDFVGDTPKHSNTLNGYTALQQSFGCNGVLAMTDNFMSYSRHQCLFTTGQAARMHNALNSPVSSRNNLWTTANLAATGTGSGVVVPPTGYCSAEGASGTVGDYLTNVSIGTINNSSGQTPYSDFTSQSTNLERGTSYAISISINTTFTPDQAYAWIDWNDDETFDNASELITLSPYSNNTATASFTVPTNAVLGQTRLRARNIYATPNNADPCGSIYGEVEDYTVNITSPAPPPPTGYCTAEGASGTGLDYLTNVSIGTINNSSGQTPYSDFTSQSTNLEQGTSYAISISINTTFTPDQAYAWIDWNDDEIFDNATELITLNPYSNNTATASFTVPTNAVLGQTRLRARNIYATPNNADPCGSIYGEVEDYTVNITSPAPPPPTGYCSAEGASGTGSDYITNVSIGTINNTSGKTPYSDFTSQSTTLEKGISYSINISINAVFAPDQAYAWADWNDDQVFDNATELITLGAYVNGVATGTVTVPTNASVGTIRLRARNIYASPNVPDACGEIYGEVEDYTLSIQETIPCDEIISDGFENGFGSWNDGGVDARRITANANTGTRSIRLRDNSGAASAMFSDPLNLSSYTEVSFAFSFYPSSMENGEDFLLEVSSNGGTTYSQVQTWARGTDFNNDTRYNESVIIPGPFTSNTVFRLRCDASGNQDHIFIDDVVVTACPGQGQARLQNPLISAHDLFEGMEAEETNDSNLKWIPRFEDISIQVYPNPAVHSVFLQSPDLRNQMVTVSLFNITGQFIRQAELNGQTDVQRIDIHGLPDGVYYLRILQKEANLSLTKRIVIKN